MRKYIFLILVLMMPWGCGSGSGSAPSGSTITIDAPVDVENKNADIRTDSQTLQIKVTTSNGRAVENANLSIKFIYETSPDQTIVSDLSGVVTLCDGARIVDSAIEKMTDSFGVYNLCLSYKSGGGLTYSGDLKVYSGDAAETVTLKVEGTSPADMNIIPSSQTISNPVVGNTANYTISGGNSPYTSYSDNPAAVQVSVSGNKLIAMVVGVPEEDTTVSIAVYDSDGNTKTIELVLDITPPKSLIVIPSSQTITNPAVGNTASYKISGGTSPYTVYSSNPDTVQVSVSGSDLTARAASVPDEDTTVTITVYDSLGKNTTVSLVLDIPEATTLAIVPSTQTITKPVVGNTASYTISGGTSPYTVYSSIPSLVQVTVTGSNLTAMVAGIPDEDTTLTITVLDSLGKSSTASLVLSIKQSSLTVLPGSVTISGESGGTATFTIYGGSEGYSVTSNTVSYQPSPSSVSSSGGTFSVIVPAGSSAATVTLTVRDSAGTNADVTMTISSPLSLSVSPSSATIVAGGSATFSIYGGSPGYTISSSNASIQAEPTSVSSSGGTFTVSIPAGTSTGAVTFTIRDSYGTTLTLSVTISSPTALTVFGTPAIVENGGKGTYTVKGGIAPYTIYTSDPGKATVSPQTVDSSGGAFTLTYSGDACTPDSTTTTCTKTITITVIDSAGTTKTLDVTVNGT